MSKIICDVCGTAYPETASACPICGSAKVGTDPVSAPATEADSSAYAYVKGGRFSKRNVRRRGKPGARPEERRSAAGSARNTNNDPSEENTNIGLVIVVVLLLLAIIAVVIYIAVRFFAPVGGEQDPVGTSQVGDLNDPSEPPTEVPRVPCTKLTLSGKTIEFRAAGDAYLLSAVREPSHTTDKPVYTSADPTVAVVNSETGLVTAVAGGQTIINVKCGDQIETCTIICSFGSFNPTEPSEPTEPVDPSFTFEFNSRYYYESSGKWEVTLMKSSETWRAYKTGLSVNPGDITWVSDDPSVATVDKGIVTAVGKGKTEIHAQYGGKSWTCIVICSWDGGTTTPPVPTGDFKFNVGAMEGAKWSATFKLGDTWQLVKKDSGIDLTKIVWTVDNPAICKVENGKLTALATGKTEVHAQYEGQTYTCIIYVN